MKAVALLLCLIASSVVHAEPCGLNWDLGGPIQLGQTGAQACAALPDWVDFSSAPPGMALSCVVEPGAIVLLVTYLDGSQPPERNVIPHLPLGCSEEESPELDQADAPIQSSRSAWVNLGFFAGSLLLLLRLVW